MYAKATPLVFDILADAAHAGPVAISPPAMPLLRLVRDESPVIVVWRGRTDGRVVRLPYQFYHAKPSRRLLVVCLAPGESPPAPHHGVVYLPWCDAEQTRAFVQLAGGDADAKVYADWLVPRNPGVLLTGGLRRLNEIITNYPQHLLAGVNAAALCHTYPCDRRTLERYFHFGAAVRRPERALAGGIDAVRAGKVIDCALLVICLTECAFEKMAGFVMA